MTPPEISRESVATSCQDGDVIIHAYGTAGYLTGLQLGSTSRPPFLPTRILDIGANIGVFAQLCHRIWPEAHVTSIEANESCRHQLEFSADRTIIACLSDAIGTRDFWLHDKDQWGPGNSYYKDRMQWYDNAYSVPLKTTTLSALFADDPPFQLIKLDTQGSELDIVRGGPEIIRQAKLVLCEVSGPEVYNIGAPHRSQVTEELRSLGFGTPIELEWWYESGTENIVNVDLAYWRE